MTARRILERLEEQLDASTLQHEIDEPIDAVLEAFLEDEEERLWPLGEEQLSPKRFHTVLARFAQLLHRDGLRLKRHLSEEHALAEAIEALRGYPGLAEQGPDAAYYDARRDDGPGLVGVLEQMVAMLKADERLKRQRAVFATAVDPADWETQCRITKILIEPLRPYLDEDIREASIGQLAAHWEDLFLQHLQIRQGCVTRRPQDVAVQIG